MLYSEFIENVGCKNNDHNYDVYCNLETMYMNSDLPKSTIYEYGKKLVDNSKSEMELALEEKLNYEIEEYKRHIKEYRDCLKTAPDHCKKWYRDMVKYYKRRIAENKWILGEV